MLKFCIISAEKLYVCLIYFFIFMKQEYLPAAEVINSFYDVQSTFQPGRKYQSFMVYDDDITAVLRSAHIYKALKRNNPQMKFVAVGGEGLLAVAFKVMRFEVYDGLFLKKPDLELTDVVRRADDLLRPKFLIKQRLSGFKAVVSYLQYIPIVWDIFMHSVL